MFSPKLVARVAAFLIVLMALGFLARIAFGPVVLANPNWMIAMVIISVVVAYVMPVGGGGESGTSSENRSFLRKSEFLCDSCKYDNNRDCSRPERPNATDCPDFRPS